MALKITKDRINKILKILRDAYPNVKTALDHGNAIEMLVATILSAQCTDVQVNKVTKPLFRKFYTAKDFAEVPIDKLEEMIRSTGFYRNKAKNIKAACKVILEECGGEVPDKLETLVKLPGVGRKTANVILGSVFKKPGVVVDTHVKRLSKRLGLTEQSDPVKIEFDLMSIIPKDDWIDFSHQLVWHGRRVCTARKPKCPECPLKDLCDYGKGA